MNAIEKLQVLLDARASYDRKALWTHNLKGVITFKGVRMPDSQNSSDPN